MFLNVCAARVAPKLVRLYDSQQFYEHAGPSKILARKDLADAVVDLLSAKISERESELVADILTGLIRQAEDDLKKALSQRLATLDHVPLRVVLHLANDTAPIAAPLLEHSPVLSDMDLIYIVKSHSAAHWQAIARRSAIGAQLIDVLADTNDLGTARALAENRKVVLTGHALGVLGALAESEESLAGPLLQRPEMPKDLAMRLYRHVGAALRENIVARFAPDARTLAQIDDVLNEFTGQGAGKGLSTWAPTQAMIEAADNIAQKGKLSAATMTQTLQRGQISSFIAQISALSSVHPRVIEAILHQSSGARLAELCRALEIGKADFTMMFLLTHRMRSAHGVMTQKDLARALAAYEGATGLDMQRYLEACRKDQAAFREEAASAATPGKSLPSIHSRKAPPAVET